MYVLKYTFEITYMQPQHHQDGGVVFVEFYFTTDKILPIYQLILQRCVELLDHNVIIDKIKFKNLNLSSDRIIVLNREYTNIYDDIFFGIKQFITKETIPNLKAIKIINDVGFKYYEC